MQWNLGWSVATAKKKRVNNAFCAELYVGRVKLATCQAISAVIVSPSGCAAAAISSLSCWSLLYKRTRWIRPAMQTLIRQKRPNFRIPYFAPPNAAPCTVPLGADTPSPFPPPPSVGMSRINAAVVCWLIRNYVIIQLPFSRSQTTLRTGYALHTHTFLLLWCWPWPDDLMYELNPDIPKKNLHNISELSRPRLSEVIALQTDRQTDTHRWDWNYHATFVSANNKWLTSNL